MSKRKLKLKTKYKNMLECSLAIILITTVIITLLTLYQKRIETVGTQKAGAIKTIKK